MPIEILADSADAVKVRNFFIGTSIQVVHFRDNTNYADTAAVLAAYSSQADETFVATIIAGTGVIAWIRPGPPQTALVLEDIRPQDENIIYITSGANKGAHQWGGTAWEPHDLAEETVLTETINQAAHGFSQAESNLGLGVYPDVNGVWRRGDRDDLATTAVAIVSEVIDTNTFVIAKSGFLPKAAHGLAFGAYYLGTNGVATNIIPTTGWSQELFRILDDDNWAVHVGQPQNAEITATDEELRGGTRPDNFDNSIAYSKGSRVYQAGQSWIARTDVAAGQFVPTDWRNVGSLPQSDQIQALDDESLQQSEHISILRGAADPYPNYNPVNSSPYPIGTVLHDPATDRDYRAKVEIPANDGTFDDTDLTKWDEVSVATNNLPALMARRLEENTADDRLDASAIKNLPSGGGQDFISAPFSGLSPAGGVLGER